MDTDSFNTLHIFHILDGLRDGLSHFSGASRAALVYAVKPGSPVRIYDPQQLLDGHEPMLKERFLHAQKWRKNAPVDLRMRRFEQERADSLQMAGLISVGGWSRTVFYQKWFTEHHPNLCSIGPIERWLEHAAWLLAQDAGNENMLVIGASGQVLQGYGIHAIRDHLVDRRSGMLGWDTQLRVYPVLESILQISRTPEEGKWPHGKLIFVEPSRTEELRYMVRFPEWEQPSLANYKHISKLLQAVEKSDRYLVSDGRHIIGIAYGGLPMATVMADFKGEYGFLRINEELVCSFAEGTFYSSNRKANLVQLEEALLESRIDMFAGQVLFQVVSRVVNKAYEEKHGCTLVLDLNRPPVSMSGQKLEHPLDLYDEQNLQLVESLTRLDGAVHIGSDFKVHNFACLMDGRSVPGENRARGARFNSALRFTAERDNIIAIVVSADRPVSIIQNGIELTGLCEWKPLYRCAEDPPTLEEWMQSRI